MYRRWWSSPQAPTTGVPPHSPSCPVSALSSVSLPLPFHSALYGYVHPESIGRQEYTPTNPNCWETFQIPLDVCFEFKYRRAFELGRVIQPRASTSRTSLRLLNRVSSASAFADFLSRFSQRISIFQRFFFVVSHRNNTVAIDTLILLSR